MEKYKVLNNQIIILNDYKLVPIRFQDRLKILNWRNDQLYHLRQDKPLTKIEQDNYFNNVVIRLFDKEKPEQLLFSYLKGEKCIGYGGLVHINWINMNAEISFIMDTQLENDYFEFHWGNFLKLIEKLAFKQLNFFKIYTYALDLRPKLYKVLENSGYKYEAKLINHSYVNESYINVIIHSKFNSDYKKL